MVSKNHRIRVLYSFPHKIGAARICNTAWHQVEGVAAAGVEVTVFAGSVARPLPKGVKLRTSLAWKKLRIPYRVLGTKRACALHDSIVARSLNKLANQVDIIHLWPLGALRTIQAAKKLGIPTVLERPNAHTRFAYEVVKRECQRLGITMPPGHEHAFKPSVLAREEIEYKLADRILCPSDFVARTFIDEGFVAEKIACHQYGYDEKVYFHSTKPRTRDSKFRMLFVGGCAPRKGLHYALEAWLKSTASKDGEFLIAGTFIPGYAELLAAYLSHPSIKVLGHRNDVPDLMRSSDALVLPTIEEGSALVTYEAKGCGCVLLVSEAAGAVCTHMKDALVHRVADVATLAQHVTLLHNNRQMLASLREESLKTAQIITWLAAGKKLAALYDNVVRDFDNIDQQPLKYIG